MRTKNSGSNAIVATSNVQQQFVNDIDQLAAVFRELETAFARDDSTTEVEKSLTDHWPFQPSDEHESLLRSPGQREPLFGFAPDADGTTGGTTRSARYDNGGWSADTLERLATIVADRTIERLKD